MKSGPDGAFRVDFSIHSLGSGSSGNSTLIQAGGTKILLDAGVPVSKLQKRLSRFRVCIRDLDAVFLTHEHDDHSHAVWSLSKRHGIPIIANPGTLHALWTQLPVPTARLLDTGACLALKDLAIESFPVSHDAAEPVGYNIYYRDRKASFVTDTGIAGREIPRRIEGSRLVVVEANHDTERLISGPYPWFLKTRILSEVGHLSNESAADLILEHVGGSVRPTTIWLAHLSMTNNSPRIARRYVQYRLSQADCAHVTLDVIPRDSAGLTWHARGG